jgi:hypothetical protein
MKTTRTFAICLLPFAMLLGSCNKNPFDRTQNASGGGPTGTFTGSHSFVIFNNELSSGGGAFEFPGSDAQSLSFDDMSNPISRRSIRYSWTGQSVAGQTLFTGFDLMHTPTLATYASTPGRDLRAAGYTKVTFFARGSLSTRTLIKVEVAEPSSTPGPCISLSTDGTLDDNVNVGSTPCGNLGVLSGSWQQYTIHFPTSDLAAVKDLFKATFIFNPMTGAPSGQGGTVYFDVIQYQP